MFEKISNAAERLATNVSESRRGFLVRMGETALGVAGVVGGLLALPRAAQATARNGYCRLAARGGGYIVTAICRSKSCQQGRSSACAGQWSGFKQATCGVFTD